MTFCNDDLKQVYHEIFDEALEAYNAGKKKTRDKIPDYYEHIRQSKQEKLFHEAIFQIGNLNDCGCGTEGGQRAAEALIEYAKSFQERNPHLHVFNMVLHMDEATPHLHVDYIPVATEQTRGLSTRVSMKQALKQQGFTGVGRKQTEWKAWMDREKEVLTEIAQQHEFEIISLGSNRRHMELPEYRAAIQEAEAVQEQTAAALQELADMQEKKTELKGEIKSLSGTVAALKAAERVRVDFRYHPAGKNAHRGCQGRYCGPDPAAKGCSYDWSCRKADGRRSEEEKRCAGRRKSRAEKEDSFRP